MKAFHLKPQKEIVSPFCKEVEEMLTIEKERSIQFQNGGVGYILNDKVIAPFFYKESCIGRKYGQQIVLAYEKTTNWGISVFNLPFGIPCELLHFRHKPILEGTFFFKVSDDVQLCRGANVQRTLGRFEVGVPADFCPVFDRYAHLIGFNVGLMNQTWLTVKIEEII